MFNMHFNKKRNVSRSRVKKLHDIPTLQCKSNDIEYSFGPLNIYFWIHGIGFTKTLDSKFTSFNTIIASVLLVALFDGNVVYRQVVDLIPNFTQHTPMDKKKIFLLVVLCFEMFQRYVFYCKRREIFLFTRQLADVYATVASGKRLNFRNKLIVTLVVFDVSTILVALMLIIYFAENFAANANAEYSYGFIPPPFSYACFYVALFLSHWNIISTGTAVLFCCQCYVLTEVFKEFKNLCYLKSDEMDYLFNIYNDICELISSINGSFHRLLATFFFLSFSRIFYESFVLIFDENLSDARISNLTISCISNFSRFIVVCILGDSVKKAASEIKKVIYFLKMNASEWRSMRLAMVINNSVANFRLFGSIDIDTTLILNSTGNLLTYGMIIATFNANTSARCYP